jgi:hypothetical protein
VAGEIPVAEAARITGLAEKQIGDVIAELRTNGPSLVLGRDASPEALAANIALGAPGHTMVARRETPVPEAWQKGAPVTALEAVPDASIRVLFIDESAPGEYIPWSAIAPKLAADGALVVAFAWTVEGYGRHARFTLAAPVYGEALDDIPAAVDGTAAAFRFSVPLIAPPTAAVNPSDFIAKLAGLDADHAFRERADAIHQKARGQVFTPADSKTTPLEDLAADDFWKALNAGGCWMDDKADKDAARKLGQALSPAGVSSAAASSGPLAFVVGESAGPPLSSPLSSKLYRESNLRQPSDRVALAPATASAAGLANGSRAVIETGSTRLAVTVALDPGLPPGVVRIAAGSATCDFQGAGARGKVVPA